MPLLPRRAALCGLAAAACLVPAAGASAYSPGAQGQVGVAASYVMNESTFDAIPGQSPGDSNFSDADSVEGTLSAAASGPGFDPMVPPFPPGNTACTGGCADAESFVGARADVAAGVMETFGRAWGWANGDKEAHGGGTATSNIDDTITVSEDTVVTLRGVLRGRVANGSSGDEQLAPTSQLELRIGMSYCGGEGCDFAVSESIQPGGRNAALNVDRPFEVKVPLQAGKNPFNAELRSMVSATGTGLGGPGSQTTALADAYATNGDAHRAEFEIEVPAHVSVSSGSGKLPIVGGKAPEEDDTTPPTLSVPGDLVVNATSPAGAVVSYAVEATDDSGKEPTVACGPGSGSTFPMGVSKVTCTATDAAGNTTSKTFYVTVRSAADQVDALRAKIDTLGRKARAQLRPHAKATCQGMRQIRHHTTILHRQGDLSPADKQELDAMAAAIAVALGC